MLDTDPNILVKKLYIFSNINIKNIFCNNCKREVAVTKTILHNSKTFCDKECFWSYYFERDCVDNRKHYLNFHSLYSDKHYIVEYYNWDFLPKQEKNNTLLKDTKPRSF